MVCFFSLRVLLNWQKKDFFKRWKTYKNRDNRKGLMVTKCWVSWEGLSILYELLGKRDGRSHILRPWISENVFILPSQLIHILAVYRILSWGSFSFRILKVLFHCFLCYAFSLKSCLCELWLPNKGDKVTTYISETHGNESYYLGTSLFWFADSLIFTSDL